MCQCKVSTPVTVTTCDWAGRFSRIFEKYYKIRVLKNSEKNYQWTRLRVCDILY
jgi:hypothetical protein